jgi:hypothetical protein
MRNLMSMMKNFQNIQENLGKMKEEMAAQQVTASAGGGMVEVTVNGMQQVVGIKIDKECVDPENVEMIEDLVLSALREAQSRAQEMIQEKARELTGGMEIPGLF